MTSFSWQSLSEDDLRMEAHQYRWDHDDGSECFFDPDLAYWCLEFIDPAGVGAFETASEAKAWLDDEISMLRSEGQEGRAASYESMLQHGFSDPVVVGVCGDRQALWDGYHRTAIALIRGEQLFAIVGRDGALTVKLEPCHAKPCVGLSHLAPADELQI